MGIKFGDLVLSKRFHCTYNICMHGYDTKSSNEEFGCVWRPLVTSPGCLAEVAAWRRRTHLTCTSLSHKNQRDQNYRCILYLQHTQTNRRSGRLHTMLMHFDEGGTDSKFTVQGKLSRIYVTGFGKIRINAANIIIQYHPF